MRAERASPTPTPAGAPDDHQHPDEQLRQLTTVFDVPNAAAILGLGRTAAYELIRTNRWPTPVVHVGKLIRIPTVPLLRLIGLER